MNEDKKLILLYIATAPNPPEFAKVVVDLRHDVDGQSVRSWLWSMFAEEELKLDYKTNVITLGRLRENECLEVFGYHEPNVAPLGKTVCIHCGLPEYS